MGAVGRVWCGWLHREGMEALTAQMVSSPQKQRGPQRTGATLTRGPTSLPASSTVPPATHSIVPLTHPCSPRLCHWGQKGGRRSGWLLQGLSLGSQGSQVSTALPASQPHLGGAQAGEGAFQIPETGEGADTKCSFGLRDAVIGCLSEMPGLARRLGLGIWE